MKSTINTLETGKIEGVCDVEKDLWKSAQKKAFNKLASHVTVKGFRPGKAPEKYLRERVSQSQIFNEAIDEVLNNVYGTFIYENKLQPYSRPEVSVTKLSPDELQVKFTVTLFPSVTLGEHKGLVAEKKVEGVTDKEVEDAIQKRLANNADLVVVDREAKKGDTLVLDFVGEMDGAEFDGGSAKNYELELGSNSFVPGFEDSLVGTKSGESKDVNITFPTQYVKELAGKPATFHCTIHEVKEKRIPVLSDDAVKDFGIKGVETVEAMKDYQKKTLAESKARQADEAYYNALVAQIVKNTKVEIADSILAQEAASQEENTKKQVESNGLTFEQYLEITGQKEEDLKAALKESAKANLSQYLTLQQLAHEEGLDVSDAELDTEVAKLADQYKMGIEDVKKALGNLENFRESIRSRKVREWILANNGVAEAKSEPKKEAAPKKESAPKAEKKPAAKKAPAKKAPAKKDADK